MLRKNLMQRRAHRLGAPVCHGHADERLSGDAALGAHRNTTSRTVRLFSRRQTYTPRVADPSPARREALTVAQLEARLPEFESAIRTQGLREKTIASYVGYTRFFLRWLAADGTPERWVAQRDRQRTRRVLDDLAHRVDEDEIRAALTAYDVATKSGAAFLALTAVTGGFVDLSREDHRDAVLAWLWAWRCRHLRREDHDLTSRALGEWWEAFSPRLPPATADLTSLEEVALADVERAYDALAGAVAARSGAPSRRADPTLGDTAASEVLVAVRPRLFVSWNQSVRDGLGWWGGSGAHYLELLSAVGASLAGLADRLGTLATALPARLGRPDMSPAQIADAYLWVTVTRRLELTREFGRRATTAPVD